MRVALSLHGVVGKSLHQQAIFREAKTLITASAWKLSPPSLRRQR